MININNQFKNYELGNFLWVTICRITNLRLNKRLFVGGKYDAYNVDTKFIIGEMRKGPWPETVAQQ